MTWHTQFSFFRDEKWCVTEVVGELSEAMRKAEREAERTLGGEPQLIRMVASRMKENDRL